MNELQINDNKKDILIIDDDPEFSSMVSECLSENYHCVSVLNGKEGLIVFDQFLPKVVLVDLNLPDCSGFDLCKKLKERRGGHYFSIFMVTGFSDIDSKIKAFEVGVDDFLTKSFELEELTLRVKRSIDYIEQKELIHKDGNETRELANIAMAQASQYSYVMNFFKALNECKNQKQIVKLFFSAMEFFNLKATLMLKLPQVKFFDVDLGDVSPIEQNIYEVLNGKSRLYEFGSRLMVNDQSVSFLVKNLPDDEHLLGQIRDFLAALVEGMDAKIKDLELKTGVLSAVTELSHAISEIEHSLEKHSEQSSSVMVDILSEISGSYHSLDMTEEQESFFINLIEQGQKKATASQADWGSIIVALESIQKKMEFLKVDELTDEDDDSEVDHSDIDLF